MPETALWMLFQRAAEAARPGSSFRDPLAIELVRQLDFPFEERFGSFRIGLQRIALRAKTFDREVHRHLATHRRSTVVSLGEGLETQFWRVDDGKVRWLSVDLPEMVELRRQLLPASERQELVACSATDSAWLDRLPSRGPEVLVVAQGLFSYLSPEEVHGLVAKVAAQLPGGMLLFDAIVPWLSARSVRRPLRTRTGYELPPMRWGVDSTELRQLAGIPGVASAGWVRPESGKGLLFGGLVPLLAALPPARDRMPVQSVYRLTFAAKGLERS